MRWQIFGAVLSFTLLAGGFVEAQAYDTVHLKNGGRIFGEVLVEDPSSDVAVKLADGSTKTVPFSIVDNIEYNRMPSAPAKNWSAHRGTSDQAPARRGSRAIVFGSVVTALGVVSAVGGLMSFESSKCFSSWTNDCTGGTAFLIGGGVAVSLGLPFLIVGLVRSSNQAADSPRSAATFTLVPSVGERGFLLHALGAF